MKVPGQSSPRVRHAGSVGFGNLAQDPYGYLYLFSSWHTLFVAYFRCGFVHVIWQDLTTTGAAKAFTVAAPVTHL